MLGTVVDVGTVADLDDAPEVHHRHPVGDVADDREVVGDEEVGDPQLVLEVLEEVHHPGLDRHVERGDRLVEHEQLGLEDEGPGDPDALTLTAGELVGEAVGVVRLQPHELERVGHALPPRTALPQSVDVERLGDRFTDRHPGVEGGERVLEDDLDVLADLPHLPVGESHELTAVEADRAGRGRDQLQHRPARGRLPAARLADQAEGLSPADGEVDLAHRVDHTDLVADERAAPLGVVLDQLGHRQQGLGPVVGRPVGDGRTLLRPGRGRGTRVHGTTPSWSTEVSGNMEATGSRATWSAK